jgi:hypothetical protein
VPGAASRFANELRSAIVAARGEIIEVPCGPATHRLETTGDDADGFLALDHDDAAERVVLAVGGAPPPCLVLVDVLTDITVPRLWSVMVAQHGRRTPPPPDDVLVRLPSRPTRRLLATHLAREFDTAGAAVRESVAKLGLALLAPTYELTPDDLNRFQRTREFPRWDVGPRPWTDQELVLLHRWFRSPGGDRLPHVGAVPTDPAARRVVAQFAADTLDDHHLYTRAELAAALSPIFHNVSRLVRLLLDHDLLEESNGCFRTALPATENRRRNERGRRTVPPVRPTGRPAPLGRRRFH